MEQVSRGFYIGMILRFFVLVFAVVVVLKMYVARDVLPSTNTLENVEADQQISTRIVSFPFVVRVAGLTLPAGHYRIEHVMESNRHFMIFTPSNRTNDYRVLCRLEHLPGRAKTTEQHYELDESGQNRLIALTFEGEQFKHVF